jgi:transcriptional regulator with XRE-family HTH domain
MDVCFWESVRIILNEEGKTQKQLAIDSGVKRGAINRGLSKLARHIISNPGADDAVKIARALGVTVEYLVTGTNPDGTPPEVLSIARKIAVLDHADQEDVVVLVENKLKRYSENPRKTG